MLKELEEWFSTSEGYDKRLTDRELRKKQLEEEKKYLIETGVVRTFQEAVEIINEKGVKSAKFKMEARKDVDESMAAVLHLARGYNPIKRKDTWKQVTCEVVRKEGIIVGVRFATIGTEREPRKSVSETFNPAELESRIVGAIKEAETREAETLGKGVDWKQVAEMFLGN